VTPADEPGSSQSDPEAAYYQTIEEFFVSRRGDPLFLSNADWNLIRRWREAGVPLRVVLRGIQDALDGHAHSFSRDQKVGSLAYCAREVEAARERWSQALAVGSLESGLDVPAILEGFARDLEAARSLGPHGAKAAAQAAEAIRLGVLQGRLEDVEGWLAERESALVEAIRRDEGPENLRAVEAETDRALAPYRDRMPARVLDRLRRDSLVRRLLERHGLPRLSLFHVDSGGSRDARESAKARS
jgi:hypothetical protein